jgi:hypothetical protein
MAEINNLGTVGGSVEIDVSQLQQAAQKITQIAEQIDAALSSIGSDASPEKTAEAYRSVSTALKEVASTMASAFKTQQQTAQIAQETSMNQQAVAEATRAAAAAQAELNQKAQETAQNLANAAAAANAQEKSVKKSRKKKLSAGRESDSLVDFILKQREEELKIQAQVDPASVEKALNDIKQIREKLGLVGQEIASSVKPIENVLSSAVQKASSAAENTSTAAERVQSLTESASEAANAQAALSKEAKQTATNLNEAALAAEKQDSAVQKTRKRNRGKEKLEDKLYDILSPPEPKKPAEAIDVSNIQQAANALSQAGAQINQANQGVASSTAAAEEALNRVAEASTSAGQQVASATDKINEALNRSAQEMNGAIESIFRGANFTEEQIGRIYAEVQKRARIAVGKESPYEDLPQYQKILSNLRAIRQEEEAIYKARARGAGGYNELFGKAELEAFNVRLRQTANEMYELLTSETKRVSAIIAAERSEARYLSLVQQIAHIESTLSELKHRRTLLKTAESEQIKQEAKTLRQNLSTLQEELKLQERIVKEKRNRVLLLQEARALESGNLGQAAAMEARMRWDRDYDFAQERPTMGSFIQFGLLPYSMLASQLNITGLDNFFGLTGALAGVADSIGPMAAQLQRLSDVLKTQTGLVGTLAQAGYTLLVPFGGLAAKFGAILAVVAPLGIALGALSILFAKLQEAEQERARAVERGIQLYNLRTSSAATMTSTQVREEINQRERLVSAQEDFLQRLQNAVAGYESLNERTRNTIMQSALTTALSGGIPSPAASAEFQRLEAERQQLQQLALSYGFDNIEALSQALPSLQDQLNLTRREIVLLQAAVESSTVAENDRREAIVRQEQAMIQSAELRREYSQMTLEQANREIQQRNNLLVELGQLYAAATSNEVRQQIAERINQLALENAALIQVRNSGIAFGNTVKAVGQTFREVTEMAREFEEQERRIADERRRQSKRDLEDLLISRGRQLQDLLLERAREREDRERELAKRLADLQKQDKRDIENAEKEKAKLRLDYRKAELKAAEDLMRALRKIYEEGRINILEAAARLDARGVFEAQRRMQQQIREAMERAVLEGRDRGQQVRERIAEIDRERQAAREERWKAFKEQLQDEAEQERIRAQRRAQDFMIQLRRENEDRALRLRRQQEDFAIEDALRRQEFNRRVMQTMMQNEAIANIVRGGLNFVQGAFAQFFGNLTQMAQRLPGVNGAAMVINTQRTVPNQPVSVSIGDIVVNATTNASPSQIGQAVRNTILYEGVGDELLRRFYGRAVVTR